MANEGSTKPTYSELESQVAFCEREMNNFRRNGRYQYQDVIAALSERVETAETSLARVRGLLQRIVDAVKLLEGTPVEYRLAMELTNILKEVANEHQNVI